MERYSQVLAAAVRCSSVRAQPDVSSSAMSNPRTTQSADNLCRCRSTVEKESTPPEKNAATPASREDAPRLGPSPVRHAALDTSSRGSAGSVADPCTTARRRVRRSPGAPPVFIATGKVTDSHASGTGLRDGCCGTTLRSPSRPPRRQRRQCGHRAGRAGGPRSSRFPVAEAATLPSIQCCRDSNVSRSPSEREVRHVQFSRPLAFTLEYRSEFHWAAARYGVSIDGSWPSEYFA